MKSIYLVFLLLSAVFLFSCEEKGSDGNYVLGPGGPGGLLRDPADQGVRRYAHDRRIAAPHGQGCSARRRGRAADRDRRDRHAGCPTRAAYADHTAAHAAG